MWSAARGMVWLGAIAVIAVGCAGKDDAPPPFEEASGGTNAGGKSGGGGKASAGAGGSAAGGASGGAAGMAAGGAGQGGSGEVCPQGSPPGWPADAPRILVLGPSSAKPELVAGHLQQWLATSAAHAQAVVSSQTTDTAGGASLLSYWYAPTGREARLAKLDGEYTWVVLLDDASIGLSWPELSFEGVRTVACQARSQGARPLVLMTWSTSASESAARAEMAYRVGNGTGTPVIPTVSGAKLSAGGAGNVPVKPDSVGALVAAASLYASITGASATGASYLAPGFEPGQQAELIAVADQAVAAHATQSHYQAPFASAVRLETSTADKTFTFMDSGTSSEAIWQDRMNEIVPRLSLTPAATALGACNETKVFDSTCLTNAAASFTAAQYELLFARGYSVAADKIVASGSQQHLTVQVWDRHYDGLPMDGNAAVDAIEERSLYGASQARQYGLAWVPYHVMFARLKTARPTLPLTSDGTHATYPVGYGLAAMSLISRTSRTIPTTGLDADTVAAVTVADESIRQLASLSQWSTFIPDDPATRPKVK